MNTSPTPSSVFEDLRVAISGGTSGLGLALVEALSRRGAKVAFFARDAGRVESVAHRVEGSHGFVADIAAKEDIYPVAMKINAALGGLDLLINNASSLGPVPLKPLADTECEDLELALATNLVGPFRWTKAMLGSLAAAAREGRPATVLNISSDAAVQAYAGWGAYSASKAGLVHLGRIWNEELEGLGVKVLSLDPGDMDTALHRMAVPGADPADLKRPEQSAAEILSRLEAEMALHGVAA